MTNPSNIGNTMPIINPDQDIPKNSPSNNFITPSSVTTKLNKKSGFKTFVIIGILIIVIVYSAVLYLYFQNKNGKIGSFKLPMPTKKMVTSTLTPTQSIDPDNIKIIDGNIVFQDRSNQTKILVNKTDYPGSGITGFIKVTISPDKLNMCFETWPPAIEPALYLSTINGSGIIEVNKNRKNCLWTKDGKNILYVNSVKIDSGTNIYRYSLVKKEEEDLTPEKEESTDRVNYSILGLSADGENVICNFEYPDSKKTGGQCEINLSTLEMSFPAD